jgi:dTDP-4-dehydrorhamnose reductase
MKVIIGSGKVANIIKNNDDIVLSHKDIEITDLDSVNKQLSKFPNNTIVVNTAAKINLEWCEENKEIAYNTNVIGAINVGKVCQDKGNHLVHVSSGCIFDGGETEKYYTELDEATPSAWYTETKAAADSKLLSMNYEKLTIIRPRQLISSIPHPTNMLTKFLNLGAGKFIDSKNSVTCIEDMKEMIEHLIAGRHYGVYNLANAGCLSPFEIAEKLKIIFPKLTIEKISYSDYVKTLKVKRVNTLLDITKLISTGYNPRSADVALQWCIENYSL